MSPVKLPPPVPLLLVSYTRVFSRVVSTPPAGEVKHISEPLSAALSVIKYRACFEWSDQYCPTLALTYDKLTCNDPLLQSHVVSRAQMQLQLLIGCRPDVA